MFTVRESDKIESVDFCVTYKVVTKKVSFYQPYNLYT